MPKLIYIPLENMPQRYTGMVNDMMKPYADVWVYPEGEEFQEIKLKSGTVLDVTRTIKFKTTQLNILANYFETGIVEQGDCFLFADIWFPGIDALRYMAELKKLKIYIGGINHAGRADAHDFVRSLGDWADKAEACFHNCCDVVFVGSAHHQHNVREYFNHPLVFNTGQPFSTQWVLDRAIQFKKTPQKDPYAIIWPHRVSVEKGICNLQEVAKILPPKFIVYVTSCGDLPLEHDIFSMKNIKAMPHLSKKEYYEFMATCKWFLATGYQETFGYSLHEAITLGCHIIAPHRACYPEFLEEKNLYKTEREIPTMLLNGVPNTSVNKTKEFNNVPKIQKTILMNLINKDL